MFGSTRPMQSPIDSLAPPPKPRPWKADEVLRGLEQLEAPADPELRERARRSLWDDVTSEYDARFLSAYVRRLPLELSPRFRAAERAWASEERAHFEGFLRIYAQLFGAERAAQLELRTPDFAPLAHLFEDEITLLVLCAYDELATVRGFSANLALYDELGAPIGRYVRRVIADEAWHYRAFLSVLQQEHGERMAEARAALERVCAAEGTTYACTFVLDHDGDEIWSENEHIYEDARRSLLGQLRDPAWRK